MKDLGITIHIISLQEYLEKLDGLCDGVYELLNEFGVVANTYVYAEGAGSTFFARTAVPVVAEDFETAINTATKTILELYALEQE